MIPRGLRSRLLSVALAGLAAASCASDDSSNSDSAAFPVLVNREACQVHWISGDGIGTLRVGMPADSVRVLCNVTRDTVVAVAEGMTSRLLSVAIGSDTVYAEVAADRVWRILVRSQGLFTRDSLSVGSSIATMASLPSLNPMVGEGYLYVSTPAHCGTSFRLSVPPSRKSGDWTAADLRSLDSTVHVTRILLLGCKRQLP